MAKKISTLSPGNLVKINENGRATQFIFLQYNHYGKTEVTLIRKDVTTTDTTKLIGRLFEYEPYQNYLQHIYPLRFDPIIRASMLNVSIPYHYLPNGYEANFGTASTSASCFLLSAKEVGYSGSQYPALGTAFSYFSSDANRIAKRDVGDPNGATAIDYTLRGFWYITTLPYRIYRMSVLNTGMVYDSGGFDEPADINSFRPAITLSSEIMVSDSAGSDGCYTIESCPAGELYHKVNGVWLKMV